MTLVTVFRHVPPPIIGMVGVLPEPRFAAFEKELDWLETTGVLVERLDPRGSRKATASERGERLPDEGDASLPLILVDGVGDATPDAGLNEARDERQKGYPANVARTRRGTPAEMGSSVTE
jgi:hypothetical protein